EPWPWRDRDERKKALAGKTGGTKDRGENEMIDSEQRQRVKERPCKAGDGSEITRPKFAPEQIDEQCAIARRRNALRGDLVRGKAGASGQRSSDRHARSCARRVTLAGSGQILGNG